MIFSRNILSITALSLLLAFVLAACGGADGADTTDEPTSTPRATATPSAASVDTDDAPPPPTPAPDPTATPPPIRWRDRRAARAYSRPIWLASVPT